MVYGRRVSLDISYNNQSITKDIDPYVTSISFSDNLSGQADTISFSLGDRERNWMNSWKPKKGASIEASLIISADWDSTSLSKRKLGYFEIDNIGISGPPNKVDVGAISIPQSSSMKGEKKSHSWEKTTLKKVAKDIANKNNVKLYFDVEEDTEYDRVDQQKESDLAFLMRLCNDAGLSLKVNNKNITILDDTKLESASAVGTIKRTDKRIKSYSGKDSMSETYKSCKVTYTLTPKKITPPNGETAAAKKQRLKEQSKQKNTPYTYTFTPSNPPKTDRILQVNEEVSSREAALKLAKKSLREENKGATTFSLTMRGFLNYYAGQTVNLDNFGGFDGKYIITSVSGSVGTGSETSLELRKCLGGY